MASLEPLLSTVAALVGLCGFVLIGYFYFLKPLWLLAILKRQGLKGGAFRPFLGQLPELRKSRREGAQNGSDSAFPFYNALVEKYGSQCYYSVGAVPRILIIDPALIRQAYVNNNDCYHKTAFAKAFRLFGNGLVVAAGDSWAQQRRLINPAFNHKEIKRLYCTMAECTKEAMNRWDKKIDGGMQELEMFQELGALALAIIGKTAFGADLGAGSEAAMATLLRFRSYFANVVKFMQGQGVIPLYRHFPTKSKRAIMDDEKQVRETMMSLIKGRRLDREKRKLTGEEKTEVDLLELMLSATDSPGEGSDAANLLSRQGPLMSDKQLMDECITFLIAGHETTTNLLSWTMLLLSQNLEWQDKCRSEVLKVCGKQDPPAFEHLNQLKNITLVLSEALRLYPPAAIIARTCVKTNKLGDLTVPKGVDIVLPIGFIQRRKELWGEDADSFRPERFANGTSKASSHPMAFLPFSVGPRTCIGQNFALVEAKLILAMLVQHYEWKVAPGYRHRPEVTLTLKPKYGLPVILTKLQ